MYHVYKTPEVQHSVKCCSVDCQLNSPELHVQVFSLECEHVTLHADSLHAVLEMWADYSKPKAKNLNVLG